MSYSLPELPYDYTALEPHHQAENLEIHHTKHHAAYVAGANATLERLAEARAAGYHAGLVGLDKTLAFNISGHLLHSMFWQSLTPGGGRPEGELTTAIDEHFGSFEAMRAQLSQVAAPVQGSGWGALAYEPPCARLIVGQIYDHHANLSQGSMPLLVLDVWEHAYDLQYQDVRAGFVEALSNLVNWPDVAQRFEQAWHASLG